MKVSITAGVLAAAGLLCGSQAASGQALPDGPAPQQNAIPDSPKPRVLPETASVTPGKGASTSAEAPAENDPNAPGTTLTPASSQPAASDVSDTKAPDITPETGAGGRVERLRVQTNFVEVPFTVKDNKGQLVPGLTWREVRVFENGVRRQLRLFTVDPYPLSVAFVVDQSLPFQTMNSVNASLGAVQGAFTPYDEMSIWTYANGPRMRTDYTGAQSARIGAVLEASKASGREMTYISTGPLSQNVNINNGQQNNTMPLVNSTHGDHQSGYSGYAPKEVHTLNDAIFEAAKTLAKRPDGRRRILYVVSDGKEAGSKVKSKELIRFMQTNKISLYATVVGDSATPYVGFLDKYHIPFTMKENVLPQYASATGGEAISEFRMKGIETSFSKIAEEVRIQYTAGYYSNEPLTDSKYRSIEVQVLRPGLDVIAKKGYYPTAKAITMGSDAPRQQ